MFFNSVDFAIFLPIVFVLYWFVSNKFLKFQNLLVVIASYVFYAWWDWRFLALIIFSTVVDYWVAWRLKHEEDQLKRKVFLWFSILVNLGFLGFFKYYNFFLDNFVAVFSFFGMEIQAGYLNIILPLGISFYTFQTLSYTIDVYKKKLEPTSDFIAFAGFVSFFPQLVAGPIERASHLLPQFHKKRIFDYSKAVDGMRQILWGLFKKVVIADNSAQFADEIFNNSAEMSGSTLILGSLFFAFQIYGDFSGYSDIAIGTARLFGFNLKQNFAFPYFSRDIAEFWRRWHISLSSWFRDYIYIPLGGSRVGSFLKIRNVFIVFLVSGFWHGANWTFIVWALLNALFFLPLLLTNNNRNHIDIVAKGKYCPTFKELILMLITFFLVSISWVFFRAESLTHALAYINGIFTSRHFFNLIPQSWGGHLLADFVFTLFNISLLVLVEWLGREGEYGIEKLSRLRYSAVRWAIYLFIVIYIILFSGSSQDFIYFQF